MQATRLWFIRHGEVQADLVGAFIGRTEANLSDLGRHQAEAVAAYLESAHLDAILCSPRKRALDTAAPLAKQRNMRLDIRAGFAEMHYGEWEGLFWPQIEARDPSFAKTWQAEPAKTPTPGGESVVTFTERVHQELEKVLEEFRGRSVGLVSHAGTNRAVLGHLLGLSTMDCFSFVQDYGCVNAGAWLEGGSAQVALVNFVPGPRSEKDGE
jgi:broad specificity phosphatase PhoE